MESEHTAKTLQIALGSYDRKELRVEKNYLQEQSPALECTCFQNGGRLLEQLRQGRQFDVVILCSQLEDMSGLEFLMNIRSMDPKPNVVLNVILTFLDAFSGLNQPSLLFKIR